MWSSDPIFIDTRMTETRAIKNILRCKPGRWNSNLLMIKKISSWALLFPSHPQLVKLSLRLSNAPCSDVMLSFFSESFSSSSWKVLFITPSLCDVTLNMPLGEVGPADLPGRSGRGLEEVWGRSMRSGSGLGEVGPADLPARPGRPPGSTRQMAMGRSTSHALFL